MKRYTHSSHFASWMKEMVNSKTNIDDQSKEEEQNRETSVESFIGNSQYLTLASVWIM